MPSLFCFLHTIRGGLRWVKSPFLCDVRLYLAYLPVFYAHRTCQELLDVPKASYS